MVAPYVGAWIETVIVVVLATYLIVAPYVGAWIETTSSFLAVALLTSHPTWVRGLKLT